MNTAPAEVSIECPYCNRLAMRMKGQELYPTRRDLAQEHYHVCRNCDAWVGCHKPGWVPLGRLANAELRAAKRRAREVFDPIWQKAITEHGWAKSKARNIAYGWISSELNIERSRAHIGELDLIECNRLIALCTFGNPDLMRLVQESIKKKVGVS